MCERVCACVSNLSSIFPPPFLSSVYAIAKHNATPCRLVHFQFLYHPEYLRVGETILFREGRTKGVGRVTKLIFADGSCVELPESERTRPLGIAEGRSSTGGGNGGEGGGAGGGGGAGSSAKSPKRGGGTKGGKRAASSSPRRGQGKVLSSIHQQPVEAC